MIHQPRRDELLDLALGLLEPAQARALEAHSAGCDACRAELAALRQTRQALGGLPPIEAPERGAAVVLAAARQVAEATRAGRRPGWAAPRWLWGGSIGLAGAAALAVLLLRLSGPNLPGPLSDDREALLGQATPAATAAPPAGDAPASLDEVATAKAPAPLVAPQAESFAPARRAKKAVGVRGAQGDALGFVASPTAGGAPPAAPAPRAELAAEAKVELSSKRAARLAAPAAAAAARSDSLAERAPCRLEQRRRLVRGADGQVTGRVREGRYPAPGGEVPLSVEERFGPDGRLLGATVRAGERRITVSEADAAAGRLEPLPGVVLARTAAEAVSAPPRCER